MLRAALSRRVWGRLQRLPVTTRDMRSSAVLQSGEYEHQDPKSPDEVVNVTYVLRDGKRVPVRGKVGDNVMYLAHRGVRSVARMLNMSRVRKGRIPRQDPSGRGEGGGADMLDLAIFLKDNSRLGCQIKLTRELEGAVFTLPKATRNFYVDGHVPKPH